MSDTNTPDPHTGETGAASGTDPSPELSAEAAAPTDAAPDAPSTPSGAYAAAPPPPPGYDAP